MNNNHTHNRLNDDEVKDDVFDAIRNAPVEPPNWKDIAWNIATYKVVDILKETTLTDVLMVGIAVAVFDTDS